MADRVYRATMKGHLSDGTLVMPSIHYRIEVPPLGDEPDPSDVASGIAGHVKTAWVHTGEAAQHYDELFVGEMTIPPAIGVAGSSAVNLTGTSGMAGGGQVPQGVVVILNVHSAARSRSARGWFALTPPNDSTIFLNPRTLSAAYTADLNALAALLNDDISLGSVTPSTAHPCVYSRTRHLRGEEPWFFDVTDVTVNPRPHWLRSRMTTP